MSGALHSMLMNSGGIVTLSGETVVGGVSNRGIRVNSDGTVDSEVDGVFAQIDSGTDWIIPNGAAPGAYTVRCTVNSGALGTPGLVKDTDYALTSSRLFFQDSGAVNMTLEIKLGSNVVASGTYII